MKKNTFTLIGLFALGFVLGAGILYKVQKKQAYKAEKETKDARTPSAAQNQDYNKLPAYIIENTKVVEGLAIDLTKVPEKDLGTAYDKVFKLTGTKDTSYKILETSKRVYGNPYAGLYSKGAEPQRNVAFISKLIGAAGALLFTCMEARVWYNATLNKSPSDFSSEWSQFINTAANWVGYGITWACTWKDPATPGKYQVGMGSYSENPVVQKELSKVEPVAKEGKPLGDIQ